MLKLQLPNDQICTKLSSTRREWKYNGSILCEAHIFQQLISLKFWVLKVKHFPARRRFRKSITEHLVSTIPTLGANSHLQGVKSQAADISQIFSPTHSWKFTALDIFAIIALQISSLDILPCKYFHLIYCTANIFTSSFRKCAAWDIFENIPLLVYRVSIFPV